MEWEIFTQRRVTRIFPVNNLKYFSIRLFLFQNNSKFFRRATTFYQRPPDKSCSFNHTRLLRPKIGPHNKYAYSKSKNQTCVYFMQSTIKKAHPTKIQETQPADNFFSTNVNSSLFCLNCWRAVTYPPLFSDMAIRRAIHCWTDVILITLNPKIKIWILTCRPYSFRADVVGRSS